MAFSQNSLTVTATYKQYNFDKTDYVCFTFSYTNRTNQNCYMWVQNWQFDFLQPKDSLGHYAYWPGADIGNMFFVFTGPLKGAQRKSAFSIQSPDTTINCSYIKLLKPKATFTVTIINTDTALVNMLKQQKEISLLMYYGYSTKSSVIDDVLDKSVFYNSDQIAILVNKMNSSYDRNCITTKNLVSTNGIVGEKTYFNIPTVDFELARFVIKPTEIK
jgi:hypothetical protein